MTCVTEIALTGSTASRGTVLKRVFVFGYLTAVSVAMFGWLSAFGWLTLKVAKWLLASSISNELSGL
jgi:hypothetical protein